MTGVIRKTKHTIMVVTLALAGCRGPVQSPTATPEVEPLYFTANTSTHPLLRDLAAAYSQEHPLITIVNQRSERLPVSWEHGYALITSIPASGDFWAAPIGQDAIAIVVHPNLVIPALSATDLRRIFMGTANNWSDFGGPDIDIVIVSRESSSLTRQAFETQVMGQRPISLRARLATTPSAMHQIISQTPGAIGFLSMGLLTDRVRVVSLIGDDDIAVQPTPDTVADGSYPLQIPLLIIGPQPPTPGDRYYEFILWMQQGGGQRIIAQRYAPLP